MLRGNWPDGLPDDDQLGLPATHHYPLLPRVQQPGTGRLSRILAGLSDAGSRSTNSDRPVCSVECGPVVATIAV